MVYKKYALPLPTAASVATGGKYDSSHVDSTQGRSACCCRWTDVTEAWVEISRGRMTTRGPKPWTGRRSREGCAACCHTDIRRDGHAIAKIATGSGSATTGCGRVGGRWRHPASRSAETRHGGGLGARGHRHDELPRRSDHLIVTRCNQPSGGIWPAGSPPGVSGSCQRCLAGRQSRRPKWRPGRAEAAQLGALWPQMRPPLGARQAGIGQPAARPQKWPL
jgi:hypothetical protein